MSHCVRTVIPNGVTVALSQYPFLQQSLRNMFLMDVVMEDSSAPTYIVGSGDPEGTVKEMALQLAMRVSEHQADRIVITAATLALRDAEPVGTVLTDPDGKDDLVSLLQEETYRLLMAVTIIVPGCDPETRLFTEEMILQESEIESITEKSYGCSSPRLPFRGYFRPFILDIEEDEQYLSERIGRFVASFLKAHSGHLLRKTVSV